MVWERLVGGTTSEHCKYQPSLDGLMPEDGGAERMNEHLEEIL